MAGLTAAKRCASHGLRVVVLDKARAVGGRMATRRFGPGRFDHGAQHFSVRSSGFAADVAEWCDAGAAKVWFTSQSITHPERGREPRHVGAGAIRAIPEYLASGIEVRTAALVDRLEIGASVSIAGPEVRVEAHSVVVTAPVPQTMSLLAQSAISLPGGVAASLVAVKYDATLALLALLDAPAGLRDGHATPGGDTIAWIADNQHKGVSPVPAVTVHSTAAFAAAHLDVDVARWTAMLVDEVERILGAAVIEAHGHRWRYSQPRMALDCGAVAADTPVPVIAAGEVFAGARVEGAYLSGIAAADLVVERLG